MKKLIFLPVFLVLAIALQSKAQDSVKHQTLKLIAQSKFTKGDTVLAYYTKHDSIIVVIDSVAPRKIGSRYIFMYMGYTATGKWNSWLLEKSLRKL